MKPFNFACIFLLITFFSCSSDPFGNSIEKRGNTHMLRGQITYSRNQQVIPNVAISAYRYNGFINPASCKEFYHEIGSDANGKFDFTFESYCDSRVKFELNESALNLYDKCYYWEVNDLNGNNFNNSSYSHGDDLGTERGRDYNFRIQLQPIVELELIRENNIDELII